jgi:hypothetical protein
MARTHRHEVERPEGPHGREHRFDAASEEAWKDDWDEEWEDDDVDPGDDVDDESWEEIEDPDDWGDPEPPFGER